MNKGGLKGFHLKHMHISKCLKDKIMGKATYTFSGKSAGLGASLQGMYTYSILHWEQAGLNKYFLSRFRTMISLGLQKHGL